LQFAFYLGSFSRCEAHMSMLACLITITDGLDFYTF
jgi:hypothetical protein